MPSLQTTIPFSGFYESWHSAEIEFTEEQMFSDENGDSLGMENALSDKCDYKKVFKAYAEEYTKSFGEWLEIPSLKFDALDSPREFNFTTDRIFCTISIKDSKRLYAECDKEVFKAMAETMFTSRSGFHSFYNPDVSTWPHDVAQWDCNQLGCLLAAIAQDLSGNFDSMAELDLMDNARCNGKIDNWLCEATPNVERLFKIRDYLIKRQAR